MLKGVIFDMDGVIINSEPQHYEAYVMFCKDYGVEFPYDEYKGFIGSTHAKVCQYMKEHFQIPVTEDKMQEKLREYREYLIETKGYEEIAGIKELIKDLHQNGMKLAIASSSPEKEIQKVVETLGVALYFTKLVSGETVEHPKPAPDVFLKAMRELELSQDECIIIEDSGNGVKAAKAAGIPAIGFYNPDSGNQDLSPASMVVEGFEEIDFDFVEKVYQRAHSIPWRIAETKHCIIRESVIEDLDQFYELYNSPKMEFIEPLADYETEKEKLSTYIENRYPFYGYGMWTVVDKETGKVIGRAGIEERTIDEEDTTELGYMLHYLYRRNGIGFEICQGILEYAKNILYIEEIHGYTHKDNKASKKLLEKLGFQVQGEIRERDMILEQYWRKLY